MYSNPLSIFNWWHSTPRWNVIESMECNAHNTFIWPSMCLLSWFGALWLKRKLNCRKLIIDETLLHNYTHHIASILIGMTNAIPAKDINKTHQSNRLGIWLELFSRYIDSEWTKLHIHKYWLRHYSKFTAKNPIFSFDIRVHWLLFSFDTELGLNPSMGCYDHCVDSIVRFGMKEFDFWFLL